MRYLIKVSYNGKNYSGFQIQPNRDTIQSRLELALGTVFKTDINVVSSGRTDAGVSAFAQICHFDLDDNISTDNKLGYINSLLPRDIRVMELKQVNDDFHARYSAKHKTYEYYFYKGLENPIYEEFATNIGYNIDIEKMREACKYFLGVHDFSAFCASNTEVQDKTREIYKIEIEYVNTDLYKLVITGNGFLYNMVRIIMGTLVNVGLGKMDSHEICNILNNKDRNLSGKTMPAKGLILKNVSY